MTFIKRRPLTLIVIAIVAISIQLFFCAQSYAINPADFNPGRIIDDEVFYNKDGMGGVADIQNFLNAHVPVCDTWGTQPSGYGNLTRSQYAQQVGWPGPPYVCLNNYYENPDTGATSFENGGGAFTGGQSAAQIIYNAAQQYGINPKVLLVTLRKESLNLYGDSWPLKSQYKYSMGYACPDSGPNYSANCEDSKAGFYKQMTYAAWQFRYYYDHMGEYNFAPGRWNTILYNPNPGCGTKDVFIQNYATASLYIYTPYVPNDAALNAYPGEAYCGAYGNRNFWFMWQEWFGSTYAGVHISSPLRITSKYGSNVFANTPTTVSFDVTNDSNSSTDIGGMAVAVRDSAGGNHDYTLKSMIIPAHTTVTYVDTQTFSSEDTYTFSFANYSGGIWKTDYPTMLNAVEPRVKTMAIWSAPSLMQGPTVSNGPLQTGKTHTITYTLKNNSASSQTLGAFALAVRGPSGENLDPVSASPVTVAAGQTQALTYTFKPVVEGTYRFSIAAKLNDWVVNYPEPTNNTVATSLTAVSAPRVVLSGTPVTGSIDPRVGQNIPLSFKVKNNSEDSVDLGKIGLWGRDPQNRNIDPGITPVVLSPNEERTITLGYRPAIAGTYSFGVMGTKDGNSWNNGPSLANGTISRTLSSNVKDGVVVTAGVSLGDLSYNAYSGQTVNVVYKIKNYQDVSANLGKIGLWGRDPQNRNIDPGVGAVTLNPGEERTMSFPIIFGTTGGYKFGILQTLDNGATWREGPISENNSQKIASISALSSAAITQGPLSSLDVQHIHVSETTTLIFKVKNQTGVSIDLGKIGLWGRDPQNRNIDPGVVSMVLSPNEERTMSFPFKVALPGVYSFGLLATTDDGRTWTSGPDLISGQSNKITFTAKQSVTLTGSISSNPIQVSSGQCQTISYVVKNHDMVNTANLGKIGLWGRDPQNRNIDPGVGAVTLNPGEERTMDYPVCYSLSGKYNYGVLQTLDNGVTWSNGPQKETDTITNKLEISVN